ncbi:MAG: YdcF family protein, partial [Erysipelotrichaceae bacterium]|nr:YdcF family protein [Erysipelotrichaceae bacterium]
YIWLAAGVFVLVLTLLFEKLNKTIQKILAVFIGISLSVFILAEIQIVSFSLKEADPQAEYLIVLGSQLRSSGPSVDFRGRLEAAYDYLRANEKAMVITTGGQGTNEPKPEGEGGAEYLISKGLSSDRILIESESHSTVENIENAIEIIRSNGGNPQSSSIVIVSNTYHLLRAKLIANKLGITNLSCTGGHGLKILDPHYFTREFFALIKEWLTGRI